MTETAPIRIQSRRPAPDMRPLSEEAKAKVRELMAKYPRKQRARCCRACTWPRRTTAS